MKSKHRNPAAISANARVSSGAMVSKEFKRTNGKNLQREYLNELETDEEYIEALSDIHSMWDAANIKGYPDTVEFHKLCNLVEDYEKKHYPIEPPTEEAAIQFRQEQELKNDEDI